MKRHRLEERRDDKEKITYWKVDPDSGEGAEMTSDDYYYEQGARSRRDMFALGALIGILAGRSSTEMNPRAITLNAFALADDMAVVSEEVPGGP